MLLFIPFSFVVGEEPLRRSQGVLLARIALGNKIILGLILAPNMLIFKIIISTQNRVLLDGEKWPARF